MKFNCKFALVAATVLTVAPILSFPNITTTVQATTKKAQAAKNTIQVNKAPIIYDRAGNYNSKYHQNIKAGTRLKYSGKTYIIQQRFAAGIPVPTSRIIGGKLYYSIGKGDYVKESDVLTWLGNTNTVKLHFRHKKNYIYDKNGKKLVSYNGGKNYFTNKQKPKIEVPYYNSPKQLFNIGKGGYIDASQVTTLNGKGTVFLNNNAPIYDATGKQVKNKNLKQGTVLNYYGKPKKAAANTQFYYYQNKTKMTLPAIQQGDHTYFQISKTQYINAADVALVDGKTLWDKGPVSVSLINDAYAYTAKFKQNKKVLYRAGAKLTVDRTKIEGEKSPQLYLHVKGTKNYLYWGNEKDYGASPLDYRHGSTNLILQTLLHN